MTVLELNNAHKDPMFCGELRAKSPVVEIFSALVKGEDLSKFSKEMADKAVAHIKDLGARAFNGDAQAISELNTIRRFVIEVPLMQEVQLLNVFGTYKAYGFDENIEREAYKQVGQMSRIQAPNGDVTFPKLTKVTYPVGTFTVSGGYEVDYRRVQLGDMSHENIGMANVRTSIMNEAKLKIVKQIYDAVTGATIKHVANSGALTKSAADTVINGIRRYGKPSVVGDFSVLSQFNQFAGYSATVASNTILNVSQKVMEEIQRDGLISAYNGAPLVEITNPYNEYELNADGTGYKTLLPEGLAFVIPTGVNSPIETYTRGGLTSLSGTDVKTGKLVTRFDLEVGCDVAKGQEDRVGILYDTVIAGL